jgi:hypothetical protein
MTGTEQGLIDKFTVTRNYPSSRGIDHDQCQYFVLDPQHDPFARHALQVYAEQAEVNGYHALADDLTEWLREIYRNGNAQ